jgi:hypothetical protein
MKRLAPSPCDRFPAASLHDGIGIMGRRPLSAAQRAARMRLRAGRDAGVGGSGSKVLYFAVYPPAPASHSGLPKLAGGPTEVPRDCHHRDRASGSVHTMVH